MVGACHENPPWGLIPCLCGHIPTLRVSEIGFRYTCPHCALTDFKWYPTVESAEYGWNKRIVKCYETLKLKA